MKTLICNGLVYDGSLNDPIKADILLEDNRIARIGLDIKDDGAALVDASGLIVTPGFIDIHRHADLRVFFEEFGTVELAQGITSTNVGVCGFSLAPHRQHTQDLYKYLMAITGPASSAQTYPSIEDYLNHLRHTKLPLNISTTQGLAAIRVAVKGYDSSPFTKEEMTAAQALVQEAIDAGIIGFTAGLVYQPEIYNSTEEIIELLKPCKGKGLLYMPHMRNEGDKLVEAVAESIRIAKECEMSLNISHFKALGKPNWGKKIDEAIALIEQARGEGLDVTVDFYPYHGVATTLAAQLPPSFVQDGVQATIATLKDPVQVDKLRSVLSKTKGEMPLDFRWQNTIISSVTRDDNRKYLGKSLKEGASIGNYEDEIAFMADLLYSEEGMVCTVGLFLDPADIEKVVRLPYSMLISDSLYDVTDTPHPRLYGSFPRLIRKYVLEDKVLTLPEAIHKMTMMPAERLKLKKRGQIKEGYFADLCLFDPKSFKDNATFERSNLLATGMKQVYVNGEIAYSDKTPKAKAGVCLIEGK